MPTSVSGFVGQPRPCFSTVARWTDDRDAEKHVRWARELSEIARPFSTGAYVSYSGDEGQERVRAAYDPETYARLVELKKKYDPQNLFRRNQNINPAAP